MNSPVKYQALDPKYLFQGELKRGMVVSTMSGVLSNTLNALLLKTGINTLTSSFLSLVVFGNLFSYSSDILFAKEKFSIPNYKGKKDYFGYVPYKDIGVRFKWLLSSVYKKFFLRYLITIIIDSIIGLTILEFVIDKLDEKELFMKQKVLRNAAVGGMVAIVTFILYVNKLRFQWAYKSQEDPIMNTIILMWLTLLIVIYLGFKIQEYNRKKKDEYE